MGALEKIDTELGHSFSRDCLDRCPQLHTCAVAALLRSAVDSGKSLEEHLTDVISEKQAADLLPEVCEKEPGILGGNQWKAGGYKVRLDSLQASTFSGIDIWENAYVIACRQDIDRLK